MDYKRLIIFYFRPKGEMTNEELSEKSQNTLDENSEEDELEIPAFLRRQKN